MKLFSRRMEERSQALTREDVIDGFRWILGREPESEQVILQHMTLGDRENLRRALLKSEEFVKSRGGAAQPSGYEPASKDAALFDRYHRRREPVAGAIVDFLGTVTSVGYSYSMQGLDGIVEGPPIRGNFHAGAIEWVGLLRAVDEAEDRFAMAEFGAGWAPWLVAGGAAARIRGIDEIALIGVEADDGHFGFMKDHLARNGFGGSQVTLHHAAIGTEDGVVMFPDIDPREDWGAAAASGSQPRQLDYRGRTLVHKEVQALSPKTILKDMSRLDLCHIDVQGTERSILDECLDVFTTKVRRVVVGTHSRSIEGALFDRMSAAGWILELEEPCQFRPPNTRKPIDEAETVKDGTQVWLNGLMDQSVY